MRLLLPNLLKDKNRWNSLIINKYESIIHRLYTQIDDIILNIYMFTCKYDKHSTRSHSWHFAIYIIKGGYEMEVGFSKDRNVIPKPIYKTIIKPGDKYEITSSDI